MTARAVCRACGVSTRIPPDLARTLKRAVCVSCHQDMEIVMPLSPKLEKSLSHQKPDDAKLPRIEALRLAAKVFGAAIEEHAKPSREAALAITNLEQALMWAIKGVVLE